jgi:predicted nucleic acid-binding protein
MLTDLIDAGTITLVRPNRKLVERAYRIAARHKVSFYDSIFVALAIEMNATLGTLDFKQDKILKMEKARD